LGAPLVAVIDVAYEQYPDVIARLRQQAPWSRVLLISERRSEPLLESMRTFRKPFDAAALAEVIEHEREIAELERRRLHTSVKAEELALLLQSSLEAIVGVDASGKIAFWNQGAERTYGYSGCEAVGASLELIEGDVRGQAPWPLEVQASLAPQGAQERVRRHKQGHEVIVLVSRSYAPENHAGGVRCAEVSLDVTRQRQLERELEHSKRLAHLGRIAATLSHEINNPLAAIRSYASWLQITARRSKDSELVEVSNDLDRASERIAMFVDQMTGFARRGSPNLELVSLSKCLCLSSRMVRARATASGVTLSEECGALADAVVAHDPTRLSHALINVLSNAIDAAASGGQHVWLRMAANDEQVVLTVDDDGPGIAKDLRARVFEPFYTTKPFGRGTGLGLWLTEQILNDHRGRVQLEDRPGGGTRVQLVLPHKRGE
jgi:two-component system sensor histidine kinase AtoS